MVPGNLRLETVVGKLALKMVVRTGSEHGGANNTSIFFAGMMFGRRSENITPTVPFRRHAASL